MDQIEINLQTQMYVVAGVALVSIVICFALLILFGVIMVKLKRLTKEVEELNLRGEAAAVDHQFQTPHIHPQEELARRGFFKFPLVKTER